MEQINKADAPLYIDVKCYVCEKSLALSNSVKVGGRDCCQQCADEFKTVLQPDPALLCVGCGKEPKDLPEYVSAAEQDGFDSPEDYVRQEEGTLNVTNGHFLCTECYVNAGCPSSPRGWVAP